MVNKKNIFIGILGLFAGVWEYLNRPPGSAYFLTKFEFIERYSYLLPDIYGKLGGWAPEFFHAFSFSLISMGLFSKTRRSRKVFCLLWFGIDSLFEVGQNYGHQIATWLPSWFNRIPLLGNTRYYFLNGRFDIFDILAILLGASVAYIISELTVKGGESDEREHFFRDEARKIPAEVLEKSS